MHVEGCRESKAVSPGAEESVEDGATLLSAAPLGWKQILMEQEGGGPYLDNLETAGLAFGLITHFLHEAACMEVGTEAGPWHPDHQVARELRVI